MTETISYVTLPEFKIEVPNSLDEALEILDKNKKDCKVIAGGTDLLLELRQRLITPKIIIDVKNIPELQKLELTDTELRIGAAVPISKVLALVDLKKQFKALYQALNHMCDEILRNRATIGGNISTASPAADTAGPLFVHKAIVNVQSKSGIRKIPIDRYFKGVKENSLTPDELVVSINIPYPSKESKSAYKKVTRVKEDLALVGVAGFHDDNSTRLAFTAIAPTPILKDITHLIKGVPSKTAINVFKSIWKELEPILSPITDVRTTKEYRLYITEILTIQILKEIL
ncbi:MAG: FAD binding domain-containing protein [Candidatus Hodarchaeota archaeon]